MLSLTSLACTSNKQEIPVQYETKEEAEKAASPFNCEGAHKMGDYWMPCEVHPKASHNSKY